ncbi:hypothetical protein D4764_01G0005520 [Takifugu flavidus]|uniref:Uncharacterized protein n=1 Tax=Takifugu flavidus TaxID=433684 RepID=A0A5C6PQX0_9TELE|nr:hypothetical protein D4764_01G0005520 [Takifugu flavidus]
MDGESEGGQYETDVMWSDKTPGIETGPEPDIAFCSSLCRLCSTSFWAFAFSWVKWWHLSLVISKRSPSSPQHSHTHGWKLGFGRIFSETQAQENHNMAVNEKSWTSTPLGVSSLMERELRLKIY